MLTRTKSELETYRRPHPFLQCCKATQHCPYHPRCKATRRIAILFSSLLASLVYYLHISARTRRPGTALESIYVVPLRRGLPLSGSRTSPYLPARHYVCHVVAQYPIHDFRGHRVGHRRRTIMAFQTKCTGAIVSIIAIMTLPLHKNLLLSQHTQIVSIFVYLCSYGIPKRRQSKQIFSVNISAMSSELPTLSYHAQSLFLSLARPTIAFR